MKPRLHVYAVCAPKNGTGSNEPSTCFNRYGHRAPCHILAGCSDRSGHLMACSKAAYLYSIIQQVLANNFGISGISLLHSLRAALYPGREYVRQTPVRRVHRGHSSGSPWALTRRDTPIEMRTDSDAARHMAT